jgi:hypothetical protein
MFECLQGCVFFFQFCMTELVFMPVQVDRILDLIFMVYVPRFEADKLLNLMGFLDKLFFASADVWYQTTVKKLEASLKRYYLVHALQKGRPDRVLDFYEHYGESFLRTGDDCHAWFGELFLSAFWKVSTSQNASDQVFMLMHTLLRGCLFSGNSSTFSA